MTKEPAAQALRAGEWIDHDGGECPYEDGTVIDVRYGDGEEAFGLTLHAGHGSWAYVSAIPHETDVVAHRFAAQQDSQQGAGGEVKPCPFCGSKDILEREIDTTGGPYVWFACMDCGAESSGDDGREDALDQWNRRHPSGHTGGPVAVTREELESITRRDNSIVTAIEVRDWAYRKLAAQQDGGSGGGEAVGWLIESDANGPLYHTATSTTRNAVEALRFSRQHDAEAFIKAYGPNHYSSIQTPPWRAVEHRWG